MSESGSTSESVQARFAAVSELVQALVGGFLTMNWRACGLCACRRLSGQLVPWLVLILVQIRKIFRFTMDHHTTRRLALKLILAAALQYGREASPYRRHSPQAQRVDDATVQRRLQEKKQCTQQTATQTGASWETPETATWRWSVRRPWAC